MISQTAALLPEDVRADASRLARHVVHRACDSYVHNEGLRFLLRSKADELSQEEPEPGEQPRALREPTLQLVLQVMSKTLPEEAYSLVYPSLRIAFDDVRFRGEEEEAKTFQVVDTDGLAVPALPVEVIHSKEVVARRRTDMQGRVDISDLPGHRFLIRFPDGRQVVTRTGERRPQVPIRVEAGEAGRVREAKAPRYVEHGYLAGGQVGDVRAELRNGAVDDQGALALDMTPSTYAGWVTALQHDLAVLGFDPGACDGYYGLGTTEAVHDLQEESTRCTCLVGGKPFHGRMDGELDNATRELLKGWLESGRRRHRRRLSTRGMLELTGRTVRIVRPDGDPYAAMTEDELLSVTYGIGRFQQRRGDLGDLLNRMFFADAGAFDRIFGPSGRLLLFQLTMDDDDVRMLTTLLPRWRERFEKAATVPAFRLEQECLLRDNAFEPVLDVARELRIHSARGLAMLFWTNVMSGFDAVKIVAAQMGPRPDGQTAERYLARVPKKVAAIEEVATKLPDLLRDLERLAEHRGVFDDCEELWW